MNFLIVAKQKPFYSKDGVDNQNINGEKVLVSAIARFVKEKHLNLIDYIKMCITI